ncbi:MAG TPA: hypothetical protein VG755_33580 [Nannocystaceae bacterium]|nr:hypothetical protein [Nannocystaceae bacterium]
MNDPSIDAPLRAPPPERTAEETTVHTRLLRLALGVEESRAYWLHVDPAVTGEARLERAFEERWFGGKSYQRVRTLLGNFAARYDAFAFGFDALRRWTSMSPSTRRLVCHWHAQLSDPLYRRFTGELLPQLRRRGAPRPLDRATAIRWVGDAFPERWAQATLTQFGSKLLSAVTEARLATGGRDPRALPTPEVPDEALEYLLYLLRTVQFNGTMTDNPYLASVDLEGPFLDRRLRSLRGLDFRRMGELVEVEWRYRSLAEWVEHT